MNRTYTPELPHIVCVRIPGVTDASLVDTEVFAMNETSVTYQIFAESTSFTTVDEEVGTVVEHGSTPHVAALHPGEAALIGMVRGWEWDGHVGVLIRFVDAASSAETVRSYAFKRGDERLMLPGGTREGWIVPGQRLGLNP